MRWRRSSTFLLALTDDADVVDLLRACDVDMAVLRADLEDFIAHQLDSLVEAEA